MCLMQFWCCAQNFDSYHHIIKHLHAHTQIHTGLKPESEEIKTAFAQRLQANSLTSFSRHLWCNSAFLGFMQLLHWCYEMSGERIEHLRQAHQMGSDPLGRFRIAFDVTHLNAKLRSVLDLNFNWKELLHRHFYTFVSHTEQVMHWDRKCL